MPHTIGDRPVLTIAVSGATGFLGSHVVRRLVRLGHRVVAMKRRTSRLDRVVDVLPHLLVYDIEASPLSLPFQEHRVDVLVHCATHYGRDDTGVGRIIETNVLLPVRLAEAAAAAGTTTLVNADTTLPRDVSDYALSKAQFREWLAGFSHRIQVVNACIQHFYGPGGPETNFVTTMARRLVSGGGEVELTGGEQVRDFVYIDDVAAGFESIVTACAVAAESRKSAGPGAPLTFEIGSGQPTTLREFMILLRRIADHPDVDLKFGAIPYRRNEVMYSVADTTALARLGWLPRVDLEQGLRRTVASMRSAAGEPTP